jgi:hypothetical protein
MKEEFPHKRFVQQLPVTLLQKVREIAPVRELHNDLQHVVINE